MDGAIKVTNLYPLSDADRKSKIANEVRAYLDNANAPFKQWEAADQKYQTGKAAYDKYLVDKKQYDQDLIQYQQDVNTYNQQVQKQTVQNKAISETAKKSTDSNLLNILNDL